MTLKKKIIVVFLTLFYFGSLFAQNSNDHLELPEINNKDLCISHTGFTLSYNKNYNCPNWVAWDLTKEEVQNTVAKRNDFFRGDTLVPPQHRVEAYDFKDTGFDRGHMCPAGDMKWSREAMSECFLMSNICPQNSILNQQWWEHLESACRRWACQESKIFICCGPIFDNSCPPRYTGRGVKVRVPDGFFKVILSLQKDKEKAIGFIYRNTDERQTMESAATTVDNIEKITGYNFFPLLDPDIEKTVEGSYNLRKWN